MVTPMIDRFRSERILRRRSEKMSNLFVKYTGILAIICGVSVGLVAAAHEGTKDTHCQET